MDLCRAGKNLTLQLQGSWYAGVETGVNAEDLEDPHQVLPGFVKANHLDE